MKKISVWYDKEAGLLEVLFKKKIGYFRATKNEAIMERVDQNGNVIGFMIEINKRKNMRIRVVIEKTKTGYSAYSPRFLGCIATGKTIAEIKRNFKKAIKLHVGGSTIKVPKLEFYIARKAFY